MLLMMMMMMMMMMMENQSSAAETTFQRGMSHDLVFPRRSNTLGINVISTAKPHD